MRSLVYNYSDSKNRIIECFNSTKNFTSNINRKEQTILVAMVKC